MPAPDLDRATEPASSASADAPSGYRGPQINPATGLSTDYLNHFTEAVMVLEMARVAPECLGDLAAWAPKTYAEHFAQSNFSNRQTVIAAYKAADPAIRAALDEASNALNALVNETRDLVLGPVCAVETDDITQRALRQLKPLLAQTVTIINGNTAKSGAPADPQAAIDAMFAA